MRCPQCSADVGEDDRFCGRCGASVVAPALVGAAAVASTMTTDARAAGSGAWKAQSVTQAMSPMVAARTPSGRGGAVAGGILGMLGALVVVAACALPYAQSTSGPAGTSSLSIFNYGSAVPWFAAEPVAVIVLTIVAGLMLVASTRRTARAVAAGLLIAFGVQTIFLFVGYAGSFGADSRTSGYQVGIGSIAGITGGLCLLLGGLVAVASRAVRGEPRAV